MEFGSWVAKVLEIVLDPDTDDKETGDIGIDQARMFLPRFPKREYPIKVKFGKIPIQARMDMCNPKQGWIGEVKTGTTNWTQKVVDSSGQLTFYALSYLIKFGAFPKRITLYHLPTDVTGDNIKLTGEVREFETKRGLIDMATMGKRIEKAYEGIIKVTKKHYDTL